MAQPLQNITIASPAFAGLNTQGSPTELPPAFASVANNCIIDKKGRIAARRGETLQTDATGLNTDIKAVYEFVAEDGTITVFSAGSNQIYTGVGTLTNVTPAGASITADNWSIASLANKLYFYQKDHAPMVYSPANGLELLSAATGFSGTAHEANKVLAAFGRLWVMDITGDRKTIYWSDLLNGLVWDAGTAGSIDLTEVWPTGYDVVVSAEAHNDFLVIFGESSVLVYRGGNDPATMSLTDSLVNIGLVQRDAVTNTGKDLVFLDNSGVRSLMRTVQEKSSPIGDISRNVNQDIKTATAIENGVIKMHYNPDNSFILLTFPRSSKTYCFDTRFPLEDGSLRSTTWSLVPQAFCRSSSGLLYFGSADGLSTYSNYLDLATTYVMSYFSHPLAFGDSSRLKILKKVNLTTEGGQGDNAVLNWGYDYASSYKKQQFTIRDFNPAYFGEAEFNTVGVEFNEYEALNREKINTSGQGVVVTVGVENTVDGAPFAIQEINIHALIGRMV